jgi:hypothetical protein
MMIERVTRKEWKDTSWSAAVLFGSIGSFLGYLFVTFIA